jgi:hypothetical protein
MTNILEQYYRGITQQLRAEVDFINSIFQHQGLKGEGNEGILRELLTRFIPKRYGVGTGIVIDRHGNQSRQCDIVIYDNFLYPSLLSLATVHLFPVDIVYATIEVKTTLNSESVKESLANIASVRNLDIIPDVFGAMDYSRGVSMATYHPTLPVGCVFAYNSAAKKFETFKEWFIPKTEAETPKFPALVGCLDQGIVQVPNLIPRIGVKPAALAVPRMLNDNSYLGDNNPRETIVYEGLIYPVKHINGQYVAIDQSRVLLNFILDLNKILITKKISSSIQFGEHYLKESMNQYLILDE